MVCTSGFRATQVLRLTFGETDWFRATSQEERCSRRRQNSERRGRNILCTCKQTLNKSIKTKNGCMFIAYKACQTCSSSSMLSSSSSSRTCCSLSRWVQSCRDQTARCHLHKHCQGPEWQRFQFWISVFNSLKNLVASSATARVLIFSKLALMTRRR